MVAATVDTATILGWLDAVPDPELPSVTITDLGIVRGVRWSDDAATLVVALTPTYSGCPATRVIADDVVRTLTAHGIHNVRVETQLAPAWTTDWITARGRERLKNEGIAPPDARASLAFAPIVSTIVRCPRCGSGATSEVSRFGSTPCKALHRCEMCGEPFEYVKPH